MIRLIVIPSIHDESLNRSHYPFDVSIAPRPGEWVNIKNHKREVKSVTHVLEEDKVHVHLC